MSAVESTILKRSITPTPNTKVPYIIFIITDDQFLNEAQRLEKSMEGQIN